MTKATGKYTKENVKIQLVDKVDGRKSIRLEIYLNGKRTYERIPNLFIIPEDSDAAIKKNKVTLNKAEKIRKQRQKEINQSKIDVVEAQTDTGKILLSEWIAKFTEIQKARGIRSTQDLTRIARYIRLYGKDIPLVDVDKAYCLGFIDYLRSEYTMPNGEHLSSKSCFNILGNFSTAMNVAIQEGYISVNPVTLIPSSDKFKPLEHIREYLTIEEVQKLINTPCEHPEVKQAFLFACNCGLRYGDIESLTWNDINKDGEHWTVATKISKTQRIVHIPLPLQAIKWMPKKSPNSDKVFPTLRYDNVQKYIPIWAEKAGITNKTVTFYVSRHTYATMLLTLGADLYTVSKLLGHTSIRHTQRYAKIVNKKKDDAISKLDNL
jgi:integrase